MLVALIANDAERQAPLHTLVGTAMGTVWVLGVVHIAILGWQFIQPV
jgi:hypothetical protein